MTYEEFCKRVEEELATGDYLVFCISDETAGNLLAEAEGKVTVLGPYLHLSAHEIPLSISYDYTLLYSWYLSRFREQYCYEGSCAEATFAGVPLRTVEL